MTTFPAGGPVMMMTEEEYRQGAKDYYGLCLACGELAEGGCEPDARKYLCDACGAHAVMGFEMALVAGHIDFKEEEGS